ncbi:MAG: hypothetical protein JSV98_02110 [candidate division WOR-3 bacterium]|nr:MAG: hypothetical protein JSV98_02110 [candidate division WOR-3 bacterium]
MFRYLLMVMCIVGLCSFAGPESSDRMTIDRTGLLPEVVITASRYQYEDDAWSGLMPELVVSAPRFEYEDDAWSGLMSEVTVTASRYGAEDTDSFYAMSESRPQNSRVARQPFKIDGNVVIILSIMGSMILFVGLYMLPRYLRKTRTPANYVCCSK